MLRYYEALPPREVARRLDVPVETARKITGLADNGDLEHDLQALLEVVGEVAQRAGTALAMFVDVSFPFLNFCRTFLTFPVFSRNTSMPAAASV